LPGLTQKVREVLDKDSKRVGTSYIAPVKRENEKFLSFVKTVSYETVSAKRNKKRHKTCHWVRKKVNCG